ncbi:MAG: alanine dehydrogenase [Gammaproteobacteria bacterium]|nr:alanine dehydrogenase [Gammaproteobacteria bacterium]MBT4606100.1 alanine dehydrogenase [Thiotrichales bacterium]MBT3473927.1 alanine dehydrogenase [Gammaproteobacteria bacterium]MBT3967611.1 alanine dehydrogenase [Gammaproteobacteria bacterium]MBT4079469.1 alanine dehydrogenase [Gammaproteobacteria bacterium]
MVIGVPREVRDFEGRIALTPEAVATLVSAGSRVLIEQDAGVLSGFSNEQYQQAGAEIVPDAAALYGGATLIVKVKEPQRSELPLLRKDHLLFCYLHLAADLALMESLRAIGLTAIAFETVEVDGLLPLLTPMSVIAGKLSVQIGTRLLHQPEQGKGVLLGGLEGVDPGHVVVLGGGVAGEAAISVAAGLGARVTVLERSEVRIEQLEAKYPGIRGVLSTPEQIAQQVATADLLVGAVLVRGDRAPKLVTEVMIQSMEPGSVVVDISVDQGGCIETIHPTTYQAPTYSVDGVTHFAVTNMPGAVPRTASQALSAEILPWVSILSGAAWQKDATLLNGINVEGGEVVYPVLKALV